MEPENKNQPLFIFFGFFLLFLIGGFFLYSWFSGFGGLSGALYFSSTDTERRSHVHRYDFNASSFSALLPSRSGREKISDAVFNPSDSATLAVVSTEILTEKSRIHIINREKGEGFAFNNLPTSFKQNLSWSPDGRKIAYVSLLSPLEERTAPESWTFSVVNFLGTTEFVSRGMNPVFISDDELFVIKNDGLYFLNISQSSPSITKVWSVEGGRAHSAMSIAISKNRKQLAWSDPLESKVFLFKVVNGSELVLKKIVPVRGYEMVFSPNTRYLALREALVEMPDGSINQESSVFVYNLFSLQRKKLFELPALPLANVSDWQKE